MTLKASVGKNRPHIAIEINRPRSCAKARKYDRKEEEFCSCENILTRQHWLPACFVRLREDYRGLYDQMRLPHELGTTTN